MKNRIRVARTSNLQDVSGDNLNIVLKAGQPFYDAQTKLFYIGDGVSTIGQIKSDSTRAITASNVKDSINGKLISAIFENDGVVVKNATNSKNLNDSNGSIANGVVATTQSITDNSDKVATTKFVHDIMGFSHDNLIYHRTANSTEVVGEIFKCCGYVFGYIRNFGVMSNVSDCYIDIPNKYNGQSFGYSGNSFVRLGNGDYYVNVFYLDHNPETQSLALHICWNTGVFGWSNQYHDIDVLTFSYKQ